MLGGTAYLDVHAFGAGGSDVGGWPKLTSGWMVANPAVGTFGSSDRKVVAVTADRRPRRLTKTTARRGPRRFGTS